MRYFIPLGFVLLLLSASAGCSTARDPAKGFRLPTTGDPARGKLAMAEFGCSQCHEIAGEPRPGGIIGAVRLGGVVAAQPSDGYLVTAIINPAYHAARHPVTQASEAARPNMPEFGRMTVQQLTDIVAYLQSLYQLRPFSVPGDLR